MCCEDEGAKIIDRYDVVCGISSIQKCRSCIDLIYAADDGAALIERIESRNGLHTLEHAEQIGLGSRTYQLVSMDD